MECVFHSPQKKRTLKGSIELSRIKCVEIVKSDIIIPCHYKYPFQVSPSGQWSSFSIPWMIVEMLSHWMRRWHRDDLDHTWRNLLCSFNDTFIQQRLITKFWKRCHPLFPFPSCLPYLKESPNYSISRGKKKKIIKSPKSNILQAQFTYNFRQ